MELGFNTGIDGVTTGTIGSNFAKPNQNTIVTGVKTKPKAPSTLLASNNFGQLKSSIGRINPQGKDDNNMVLAAIDMITQNRTGQNLINEYQEKMSPDSFMKIIELTTDIKSGAELDKIIDSYPDISKSVIEDIYEANNSLEGKESEKPGIVKNFVSGIAGQIPKMFGNIVKSLVTESAAATTDPLYMVNKVREAQGKEPISFLHYGRQKEMGEYIDRLGEKGQKEISDYIGGDEETKAYKAGQFVAEIAPFFATKKLGGEGFGKMATKEISEIAAEKFPNLIKYIQNPTIQKILNKGLASIPATESTAIISEGRQAEPEELAVGAIFNQLFNSKVLKKEDAIKNIIGEKTSKKTIQEGFNLGNIEDQYKGIRKWWTGGKNVVKPSKRSLDAVDTIEQEIKDFATTPVKLFGQVKDKIKEISDNLGDKLDTINVKGMTKKAKELKTKINELSDEIKDVSGPTAKKLSNIIKDFDLAKTANDVWNVAKKLDDLIDEDIKRGINLSGKDKYVYRAWKGTREGFNDFLDEVSNLGDDSVKKEFKKLSNLYHAKQQIIENGPDLLKKVKGFRDRVKTFSKSVIKLYLLGKALGLGGEEKRGADL